jgi:hypothetical protein
MWQQLSNQVTPWWELENESYIYFNKGDGKWWIDGPDGSGLYILRAPEGTPAVGATTLPPREGWQLLHTAESPAPVVEPEDPETC